MNTFKDSRQGWGKGGDIGQRIHTSSCKMNMVRNLMYSHSIIVNNTVYIFE